MRLLKINNPKAFDDVPEVAMDAHLAVHGSSVFVVVGGRVAIDLHEDLGEPFLLDQDWQKPGISFEERKESFARWLAELPAAPDLEPRPREAFSDGVVFWPRHPDWERSRDRDAVMAFVVGPLRPLPAPPPRPASIYGHLPFGAHTDVDTVIYRWEAFPTSRRIVRTPTGGEISRGTYAAPASEVPFAPTGFGAVARFALPNLMPACFRWEIQPDAKTVIECGASVPLYGQSGGGVEVMFRGKSFNRCLLAEPVVLPAL